VRFKDLYLPEAISKSPFLLNLCHAKDLVLEIFNIFIWLKLLPFDLEQKNAEIEIEHLETGLPFIF